MKAMYLFMIILTAVIISGADYAKGKLLDDDQTDIKSVTLDFVNNLDSDNIEGIKKIISEKLTFTVMNSILNKTNEYSYNEFLDAVKDQQLGGRKRDYNIMNIDSQEKIAVVKIECKDLKTTQTGFISLVKDNNDWKVISGLFMLKKNS